MSNIHNKPLLLGLLAFAQLIIAIDYTIVFVTVAIANRGIEGLADDALRTATTHGIRVAVLITAAGILVTAVLALTGRKTTAPALVDAVSN